MSGTSTRCPPGRSSVNTAGPVPATIPRPSSTSAVSRKCGASPRRFEGLSRGTSGSTRASAVSIGMPSIATRRLGDERGVVGVHDVQPVRERRTGEAGTDGAHAYGRVAREESGMPVPWAEERHDPHGADEELVLRERRRAPRERAHLRLEALARDASERVGVNLLDRLPELANVVGRGRRGGGTGLSR